MVLCLANSVESRIVIIDWMASHIRVEAVQDIPAVVTKVSFCPADDNVICLSGHYHWSVQSVNHNEGRLREMPFHQFNTHRIFTQHCWLLDN